LALVAAGLKDKQVGEALAVAEPVVLWPEMFIYPQVLIVSRSALVGQEQAKASLMGLPAQTERVAA